MRKLIPPRNIFLSILHAPSSGIRIPRRFQSTSPPIVTTKALPGLPSAHLFRDVPSLRQFRNSLAHSTADAPKRTVGLVPTMGALHAGHLSLIRLAAANVSDVFVSIYVNPTQFGVTEDLSSYPRTWDSDIAQLASLDAELAASKALGRITAIFAPTTQVMYPTLPPTSEIDGHGSFVTVTPLATKLEGKSRPVFFRGVATVCMKLFNIVQPDSVYFGQKDVQQTVVLRRMIQDFHLPIAFRIGPTMRESDGLAMSSRNVYLGKRRRTAALALSEALELGEMFFANGLQSREDIQLSAMTYLEEKRKAQEALAPGKRALFKIDYISLADPDSLEEIDEVDPARGAVLSGAIIMQPLEEQSQNEELGMGGDTGPVRLIDNIILPAQK
ncbi:pantoate--beta-alanine ligase [Microthyrium microscopicum]|uniref:Pantoate--beta-alanine ligase n=1 Tax=Microthyrium microscopicum TaxID=703497 RepID=A0A6A6UJ77_9PEZI|nr:pantoate--beta-alanine ligase [Microthyrium microscopicum]